MSRRLPMPRIVRSGAERCQILKGEAFYMASDTIEIKPGWRSKDWGDIKYKACGVTKLASCSPVKCLECWPEADKILDACIEAMEKIK
jgi:hypothetical protein